jgi:hypothetical protein
MTSEYFTIVIILSTLMVWESMVLHNSMECVVVVICTTPLDGPIGGGAMGCKGVLHPSIWDISSLYSPQYSNQYTILKGGFSRNGQFLNLISQGGNMALQLHNIIVIGWSCYLQDLRISCHHLNFHGMF